MKFVRLLFLPVLMFLCFLPAYAQSADVNLDIPEGMELIEVSDGYRMIVPKGAKIEKTGGQVKVEDTSKFLMRKINALEAQLKTLEANQAAEGTKPGLPQSNLIMIRAELDTFKGELAASLKSYEEKQNSLETDIKIMKESIENLTNKIYTLQKQLYAPQNINKVPQSGSQ